MGGSTSKPGPAKAQQQQQQQQQQHQEEDYNAPLANKALPGDLQKLVDKEEESFWEQIQDGRGAESTDSSLRYAAYANRIRTILLSAHRYVAYTSDIGESFRPVAHPWLVRGAYGVSWAYLIGDVSHEGYKAYLRQQQIINPTLSSSSGNKIGADGSGSTAISSSSDIKDLAVSKAKSAGQQLKSAGEEAQAAASTPVGSGSVPAIEDYRAVMAQRAVFQAIASMGLPAFTIHSIVRYSGRALRGAKSPRIRTWGPIGLGLAAVPLLPYMFDKPVEEAVEWTFYNAFKAIGGPDAVAHSPSTGREKVLAEQNEERKIKKEL